MRTRPPVFAFLMFSLCAALLWTSELTAAGDGDDIDWSSGRRLTRADFGAREALPQGMAARSFITIKASWSCNGDRLEANIQAVFDRSRSTWAGTNRSGFDASNARSPMVSEREILQHEQTHFDLAELVARKIRAHFATLVEVCTRSGGTIPLPAIVDDYQRELDAQQARYDRETLFGIDPRMQSAWTSDTARALEGRKR